MVRQGKTPISRTRIYGYPSLLALDLLIKKMSTEPQGQGTAEEHEANGTHVWMPLFDEVTGKKKCYVCYCGFHKDLNPNEREHTNSS